MWGRNVVKRFLIFELSPALQYLVEEIDSFQRSKILMLFVLCSCFALGLAFISPLVLSQLTQPLFNHLTIQDGLPHSVILSIAQDKIGFIWVATFDGLARYDGYGFTTFKHDPRDTTTISTSNAQCVHVADNGTIWLGTLAGLDEYLPAAQSFKHHGNFVSRNMDSAQVPVMSIAEDREHNLWIVFLQEGLCRYDSEKGSFLRYRGERRSGLSSDSAVALFRDRNGTLWVSTSVGLDTLDMVAMKFRNVVRLQSERAFPQLNALCEDQNGNIWFSQFGYGVRMVNRRTGKVLSDPRWRATPKGFLSSPNISSVACDDRGTIWIGGAGGVDRIDPSTGEVQHGIEGIRYASSLYRDSRGTMWLATNHGVSRHDPLKQKFFALESVEGLRLASNDIGAIAEDSLGNLWVGATGGVTRYERSKKTSLVYGRSVAPLGQVDGLLIDHRGEIWIASDFLLRLDPRTKMFHRFPVAIPQFIYEDRDGELWTSSYRKGIVRISNDRKTIWRYSPHQFIEDSLHGDTPVLCYQDRNGKIWIGTYSDFEHFCTNIFDKTTGKFSHFEPHRTIKRDVSGRSIRGIYENSLGTMWFAYWFGGLVRLDGKSGPTTSYLDRDGLPTEILKSLLADGNGRLWIGTDKGLSRFDPKTNRFKNYTVADGLPSEKFYSSASLRTRDGTIYMSTAGGFIYFHPDSLRDNPYPPYVAITSCKVLDKPVALVGEPQPILRLDHTQDKFNFEFVALDYSDPARIQYAYMLEGFDKTWTYSGTRRYASYTHLDAGEYVFRVKAANADGIWNEERRSVRIAITPPFWRTWWFDLLIAAALVCAAYAINRYQINKALEVERMRQRIANDLHDDVGTNLSGIVAASQVMKHKFSLTPDQSEQLSEISAIARRSQEAMRDIVWVLNGKNDALDDLALKMREVARRTLKEIPCTFNVPSDALLVKVSLEFKRNVFLFYKECLSNIVKHAGATHVEIEMRQTDGEFFLKIHDNGIGFDSTLPTTGSGLNNLKQRAKDIGGNMEITSAVGAGTTIELKAEPR